MKITRIGGVVAALSLLVATQASAISLSVDLPMQFNYKDASTITVPAATTQPYLLDSQAGKNVGGFILGVRPFSTWWGVGYESWESTGRSLQKAAPVPANAWIDTTSKFTIVDVFAQIPVKMFVFTVGYGSGTASFAYKDVGGGTGTVATTPVSQLFATAGVAFGPSFDVHIGYHSVMAEDKTDTTTAAPNTLAWKTSGDLLTLGFRVGM
jgi:hypothetical protein